MVNSNTGHFRPGRIQSMNGEQEVILKQVWAYFLKYWGYDVDISSEDIKFKESFIPSSSSVEYGERTGGVGITNGLVKTNTRGSINSNASHTSKSKKKGFFERKHAPEPLLPKNSKRMRQIETQSTSERYFPVNEPSDQYKYVYYSHYNQGYDSDEDFEDDEESEVNSMDTFITASTSITDPGSYEFVLATGKEEAKQGVQQPSGFVTNYKVSPRTKLLPCLAKYKPEDLHDCFFKYTRNELLDNYVLRYIRARKFKHEDAIAMLAKTLDWRYNTFDVNKYFFEGDAPSYLNGTNAGFIKNFTVGKCYTRGVDKEKNPIVLFKARLNYSSDSPLEGTQRYALVIIEWTRLNLKDITDSTDQCSIIFDLTGFSLKNNDLPAIKFLAEIFEAHYPEILGSILIHNAPWIFSTIWNLIKNWLDPVVASKIHFTKNIDDLNKFIDSDNLPASMGGNDPYAGEYPKPSAEDMHPPKQKDANYRRLRRERDDNFVRFLETTKRWVESTNPEVSSRYLQDKINITSRLAQSYVEIDPYIRTRGIYDRNGSLDIEL